MRMKVNDLDPITYNATPVEDLDMATAIQQEYHEGREEVIKERRKTEEQRRERERKQRESEAKMKAMYG